MELDDDADDPEVEVELDSLGSLFMHLINNDTYQEDVEGSQADDVEVITLSSGSDSMPTQKIHQAVRKVRFSHPLAHLDLTFILKTRQHEARRTPQTGNVVQTTIVLLINLILWRVASDTHLIRLIRIIR